MTKTVTFPLYGGKRWSATFEGDKAVAFDVTQVTPEALAHGLSLVNRFGGATETGYSDAEHSLILADWLYRLTGQAQDALLGLLHDVTEPMGFGDPNGPLKKIIAQPSRELEAQVMEAVWTQLFGVNMPLFETLFEPFHKFDHLLGDWEAGFFQFPCDLSRFVGYRGCLPGLPRLMTPKEAESIWLSEFWRLA